MHQIGSIFIEGGFDLLLVCLKTHDKAVSNQHQHNFDAVMHHSFHLGSFSETVHCVFMKIIEVCNDNLVQISTSLVSSQNIRKSSQKS